MQKIPYRKPSLAIFGSVASVTGSNMTGSFFDDMTSKAGDTNMAPMPMM